MRRTVKLSTGARVPTASKISTAMRMAQGRVSVPIQVASKARGVSWAICR